VSRISVNKRATCWPGKRKTTGNAPT
jgi:hypothetical protein